MTTQCQCCGVRHGKEHVFMVAITGESMGYNLPPGVPSRCRICYNCIQNKFENVESDR